MLAYGPASPSGFAGVLSLRGLEPTKEDLNRGTSQPRTIQRHGWRAGCHHGGDLLPLSPSAWAQAPGMAGIGTTDTLTLRAAVRAVDPASRRVTLVGPAGNAVSLIAGPQVINFDQIKPGDTVLVRYDQSTQYILSPPSTRTPKSDLTVTAAGAAKGEMPARSGRPKARCDRAGRGN